MFNSHLEEDFELLNPRPEHYLQIQELCKKVYPFSKPWNLDQLESHRAYFPDGQLIVIERKTNRVIGMAFSLIIRWDDYLTQDNWKDLTASGYFTNHDPKKGKTLYGAEVMVDPDFRGKGIGKMLYEGRKKIVEKYSLKRIRAGSRLRDYGSYQKNLSPAEYVKKVTEKKLYDSTLSFQLNQGFKVIDVAANYLTHDPESLGYAAVIEWLNPKVATPKDFLKQEQSASSLFEGNKYVPEFLPRELRQLVRRVVFLLGDIIKESEGEDFFDRVEFYREQLKKTRNKKNKDIFIYLLEHLRREKRNNRLKIAHSFALQLELINVCEAAYRTWRLRFKAHPQSVKSKLKLTFVLTAHPTEAREKDVVEVINKIGQLLLEALQNNFSFNETEIQSHLRMLWLKPIAKSTSPTVVDESNYIFSLIFSKEIFDFILTDKPSYELYLRTWVGGDKDGHPYVDRDVMTNCLSISRQKIIEILSGKIKALGEDLQKLQKGANLYHSEKKQLLELSSKLMSLTRIGVNDGTKVKTWILKFHRLIRTSPIYIKKHHNILLINRLIEAFPALVCPIELREDSKEILTALKDKSSQIRGMLSELKKICGVLDVTSYAKGIVVSNCESEMDINNACQLVSQVGLKPNFPVIPLFESREALLSAKKITKKWLSIEKNKNLVKRSWKNSFEIMLGYSDSAKQIGVLPSRWLIFRAMNELEKSIKRFSIVPIFFHGSGGSVARGGGSIKEQIAWWPQSAIANPKVTIQGEMIQRQFASREILNSQCSYIASETIKRKDKPFKASNNSTLENFVDRVGQAYTNLVTDKETLKALLDASPYNYLDLLRIGSRPSKRKSESISTSSLRAIPWVLCWTQTRLLLPTWWGVGTAWNNLSAAEKQELRASFQVDPFFTSFVKALGFTLAKVELDIWKLYYKNQSNEKLIRKVEQEYLSAVRFAHEVSGEKELIWYRPWLQESIQLRSPNIHILNFLQILSFESNDEVLLRETIVGIASGMLTTG